MRGFTGSLRQRSESFIITIGDADMFYLAAVCDEYRFMCQHSTMSGHELGESRNTVT
jgi:hypothetical protein